MEAAGVPSLPNTNTAADRQADHGPHALRGFIPIEQDVCDKMDPVLGKKLTVSWPLCEETNGSWPL